MGDILKVINGELVFVKEPIPVIPREHKKLLHEEAIERFNIEIPDDEFYKNDTTKILPADWYSEIIQFCINNIQEFSNIKFDSLNFNKSQKTFIIQFENDKDPKIFDEFFQDKFFLNLNKFIREIKQEDPKKYNRSMVLSSVVQDFQLIIIY